MLLMALPSALAPLAAVLAALSALITAVTFSRPTRSRLETPHDCEQAIADLTLKVRRPWAYRAKVVGRWFDGER